METIPHQRRQLGVARVIADPTPDAFLGIVMLGRTSPDDAEASSGVAPRHRRRGVATRAVTLLAGWAFEELGIWRIEIRTEVSNVASRRVAEKAGFTREDVVRARVPATSQEYDDIMFVLTRP